MEGKKIYMMHARRELRKLNSEVMHALARHKDLAHVDSLADGWGKLWDACNIPKEEPKVACEACDTGEIYADTCLVCGQLYLVKLQVSLELKASMALLLDELTGVVDQLEEARRKGWILPEQSRKVESVIKRRHRDIPIGKTTDLDACQDCGHGKIYMGQCRNCGWPTERDL